MDLADAWWTPPLAPCDAWRLEKTHVEGFGVKALVSITDHDNIAAPQVLRILDECRDMPVSTEWTVPYEDTFFHLGVHNIRAEYAGGLFERMSAFTRGKGQETLRDLLHSLAANRETLIVFNHPCWDESGIGEQRHRTLAVKFSKKYRPYLHALELNGLRPWTENRLALAMAQNLEFPFLSGGDRHAMEPNTILNLTNAGTFPEFVAEIREGNSNVLITPQYLESFPMRILQNLGDILGEQPHHGRGWRLWTDRVFHSRGDGTVRSLTELFGKRTPPAIAIFVNSIGLMRQPGLRDALRVAFGRKQEIAL
jgi:hypothetical protein